MEKIILLGGGGHCRVAIDALLLLGAFEIVGIVDRPDRVGEEQLGIPIIGTDEDLPSLKAAGIRMCLITAGSTGDPTLRLALSRKAADAGLDSPVLVHPNAAVSSFAQLGAGSFVGAGAAVGPGAIIGEHVIVNTGAVVDHDSRLGDFVHVAPHAALGGGVVVGARSHIGAGSVVIQGLEVGQDSLVGAGSVVTRHIPERVVAYGNPCREVRSRDV